MTTNADLVKRSQCIKTLVGLFGQDKASELVALSWVDAYGVLKDRGYAYNARLGVWHKSKRTIKFKKNNHVQGKFFARVVFTCEVSDVDFYTEQFKLIVGVDDFSVVSVHTMAVEGDEQLCTVTMRISKDIG